MKRRLNQLSLAALVVSIVGQATLAASTLTRDDRALEIYAAVTEGFNARGIGPLSNTPSFGEPFAINLGSGTVESTPNGDAQSRATATQDSSLDASPNFMSVHAEGTANAFGSLTAFAFDADAEANADSHFEIEFNIDAPMTWSINASIEDEGASTAGRVRLRPVGGSDIFLLEGTGALSDADGGVLQPGDYELIGQATAAGFVTTVSGGTVFDRDAAFAFDFTVAPEPATGLLLLLGGVAGLRRTRC
jgi:hypothetical protein